MQVIATPKSLVLDLLYVVPCLDRSVSLKISVVLLSKDATLDKANRMYADGKLSLPWVSAKRARWLTSRRPLACTPSRSHPNMATPLRMTAIVAGVLLRSLTPPFSNING